MPLYQYKCDVCDKIIEIFRKINDRNKPIFCCKNMVKRVFSFNLITDTNFGYTGKYDPRLCEKGEKIEGRKDFWNRVKQKGLQEIDLKSLDNSPTFDERMKKHRKAVADIFK